jgi:hypothetical protein
MIGSREVVGHRAAPQAARAIAMRSFGDSGDRSTGIDHERIK